MDDHIFGQRRKGNYNIPRFNNEVSGRVFCVAAPSEWNALRQRLVTLDVPITADFIDQTTKLGQVLIRLILTLLLCSFM